MDQWGSFNNEKDDIENIARLLKTDGIVSFPYSADHCTAFIITLSGPITSVGIMPWGGSIQGTFLVALRARGSEYFNLLERNVDLHPNYVGPRLNIGESDAIAITELLNKLSSLLRGQ